MPEDKGLTRSEREEKVLKFWKENRIFAKTLEKKARKGEFIFYEGPPTANGKPGIHHLESRAFKDAIPRYKTMQGFRVPRQGGWDTHGLPVELEVEKQLGLKSKKEIEAYGVERFNAECKKNVWKYIDEWERFTDRVGYWVDLENPYITYKNSYIEKVWKVISEVDKKDLLYKDYKVVPWCPRCGTALSSHELAQGYKDVKDLSLYVKFKIVDFPDAYFLAWTTTPWTLPGNLALAVGPDITYVEAKVGKEIYVLAKDRLSVLTETYEIVAEHKGSEMIGMAYEPLYSFITPTEKAFKVYAADFVTIEDGTGIVHTAVMYGQEDFELGTKIGLPKTHLVNPDATFAKGTGWLEGRSVVDETLAVDILKDLQSRNLLFGKENHAHSYPFCWRCGTRLIYYARDSWYIAMSKLRAELVKDNEKIHWEPEHIKEGRFGEWLREVKDWAISRERYWGTPLPVWESKQGGRIVADSVETLKKYTRSNGNTFVFVRHGESESNVQDIVNCDPGVVFHLTNKGKEQAKASARQIPEAQAIYVSPFIRAKETAEIIIDAIGYKGKLVEDMRLSELNFGSLDKGKYSDYLKYEEENILSYDTPLPEGESYNDAKKRFASFLYEIDQRHKGETVVVITHGMGLESIKAAIEGADLDHSKKIIDSYSPKPGEILKFKFVPLPHNDNYELDLHKPFIDEVVLMKDGEEYRRTKEVMDVWLDSGSMPFASETGGYPADFISEAIDQTRGWFYTLHAVGVLMGQGRAFKNVICLGHILDKDGKKMSKSVGNVIEPFSAIDRYGADALRLWMYSVNQPGESKNFDERTVVEVERRIFNLLDNVFAFYELYRDKDLEGAEKPKSESVLDQWILQRLEETAAAATENLDAYKLLEPVRGIRDLIEDLSTWYVRRSRDRLKEGDKDAKSTLYYVLVNIARLLAPFAPFASEDLYQKLRGRKDAESIHLTDWPFANSLSSRFIPPWGDPRRILKDMQEARRIVSLALEERQRANVKIRQPLSKLELKEKLDKKYLELIKEEVNVKSVTINSSLEKEVSLDTRINSELAEEGRVREAIRNIQEERKRRGLKPGERIPFDVPAGEEDFYKKHEKVITEATATTFVTKP